MQQQFKTMNYIWIYKMRCSACAFDCNVEEDGLNDECPRCSGDMEEINRWKKYES